MATAVDGTGTPITLATGGIGSRAIALDTACVYWADTSGTVTRVAKP
jgi:hypothetical protein